MSVCVHTIFEKMIVLINVAVNYVASSTLTWVLLVQWMTQHYQILSS